jgi:hypothetical protein
MRAPGLTVYGRRAGQMLLRTQPITARPCFERLIGCTRSASARASAYVHVGDLDCVVSIAEPVPGRDVGLYVAGRVSCSGAEGVSADVGRLPVERPILPLVWTSWRFELRRVPVSLAGEAKVHVGYWSGA